jgi:hypothetical protein
MSRTDNQTKKWYNPDTCTIIEICQNPNLGTFLSCKLGIDKTSQIFLNEVSLNEAENKGFSKTEVILTFSRCFPCKIYIKQVPTNTRIIGSQLENQFENLHRGDSSILAFSIVTSSILVTYDKDLLAVCKSAKVPHLNPNDFLCVVDVPVLKHRKYGGRGDEIEY